MPANLELGKEYEFQKDQHRMYMLNVPMDLKDKDWRTYAKIVITEYTVGHDKTKGKYTIVRILDPDNPKPDDNRFVSEEEVWAALNKEKR